VLSKAARPKSVRPVFSAGYHPPAAGLIPATAVIGHTEKATTMTIERPMFPPRAESVDSFSLQPAIGQRERECLTTESRKSAEGLSRRLVLAGVASAAALPIAAAGIAAVPSPTPRPASVSDPIFAIIDKHQAATAAWSEAVNVEYTYEKTSAEVEIMDHTERQTYESTFDRLQEATSDSGDQMREASTNLVNTPPASLSGIVALCEYFGPIIDDEEHHLPDEIDWDDGTQSTPAGAFANAIRSAVSAMVKS
jgi:hypothetical protein